MKNSMLNKADKNVLTEENESYLERTRELLVTNILTAQTFLTCLLPPLKLLDSNTWRMALANLMFVQQANT